MKNTVIKVENLSKQYRIGQRERYYALRDVLARSLSAPFRLFHRNSTTDNRQRQQMIDRYRRG